MGVTLSLVVWGLWLVVAISSSWAQEGSPVPPSLLSSSPASPVLLQLPTARLSPVVVTATRTETPLAETAVSVTLIDEEDLQRQQADTVIEALRLVPGLDIVQNGSRGTTAGVFIRGAESDHTLVLIDGVEVNSATLGSFDFSNLTTENVERIEVVRGGGGTLYGSQAIGGVINIITKRGEGKPTASLSAEGGKGATHRETLSFSGGSGIIGLSGALASIDTEGFRPLNDGFRNFSTNLRLDVDVLPTGTFRNFLRYTDANTGLFNNKNYLGVPDLNARQLVNFFLWKGEWTHRPASFFDYRVAGSYVRDNQRFYDEPDRFDELGVGVSRIPVETFTGEVQGNVYWRDLSIITFGFEFEEKSAKVRSNFGGFETNYDKSRNNFASYLQTQLRLLNERLFLTGGFRVDDNQDFGTHVTSSGTVAYLIPQTRTKLKGGFNEGFRAPNFNELFFPDFGNPNLDAEISSEWSIGVDQALWGQRFTFEAVYFNRRVNGLIEGVLVDPEHFIFLAQNRGRVDVQGVEFTPVLRVLPELTLSGNFSYLDFDTRDGRLLRRPRTHGTFRANYQKRGFFQADDFLNLHVGVNVVGSRDDIDPLAGARTNPMFARTDTAISYRLPTSWVSIPELTIYGKIYNLFDRKYQEVLGFRSPPINYLIGVKVTF
ncbi:MAG: TonB-dependent receptor plug domain-containing protein [Candidatus Binatia bacterium]